jgi:dethiobiotin synthetase
MEDIQLVPALRQSLFIAGTDTAVGKTTVAAALLRALARSGLRAAGMKPVATGAELTSHGLRNDDALQLGAAGNVRLSYELTNPVCFEQATSPHLAAERAGKSIDIAAILQAFHHIQAKAEVVVVEGAGGWLAPIGRPLLPAQAGPTMQDVARALGLPVVLVVGIRLGCINHALLTADAIVRSGLPLAGWIANPVDANFADGNDYVESLQDRLACPLLWVPSRVILPSQ